MKYDFCIGISTYNRVDMLDFLLGQIYNYPDVKKKVIVIDDQTEEYFDINNIIRRYRGVNFIRMKEHCGKKLYWKIMQKMFKEIRNINANKYIILPDDVKLKDDFFTRANNLYDNIKDDKKICLSLLYDIMRRGKPCWTNIYPEYKGDVFKTQWNDLCFIAEKKFFEKLNYNINSIPQERFVKKTISSGVGEQISKRLLANGYSMYHVKENLIIHDDHISVMNYKERINNKLIAL